MSSLSKKDARGWSFQDQLYIEGLEILKYQIGSNQDLLTNKGWVSLQPLGNE